MITATVFLQENDPTCKVAFLNDENSNSFNVKFDFNPELQELINMIMDTGEVPDMTKKVKKAKKPRKKAV